MTIQKSKNIRSELSAKVLDQILFGFKNAELSTPDSSQLTITSPYYLSSKFTVTIWDPRNTANMICQISCDIPEDLLQCSARELWEEVDSKSKECGFSCHIPEQPSNYSVVFTKNLSNAQ